MSDSDFLPIEIDHKPTHSLPYARTIGSAKIEPANIEHWKALVSPTFKHYFDKKYLELVRQYELLIREYCINKLIYESYIGFEPIIGRDYYLYNTERSRFLSLVSPDTAFWGGYIGTFILNSRYGWEEPIDNELSTELLLGMIE